MLEQRTHQLLLLAIIVSAAPQTRAEEASPWEDVSLMLLKSSHRFGAKAGRASAPTAEARAFERLIGRVDAASQFASLVTASNPSARLYGLCGLFRLSDVRYQPALKSIAASSDEVEMIRGCFVDRMSLSEAVADAAEGKASSHFFAICKQLSPVAKTRLVKSRRTSR
jgi:hypothetical protein